MAGDLTWHIATLSKCVTPALRVAYVIAPGNTQATRLAGVLRATNLMAPPLNAALASRWIADGTLAYVTAAIREENAERQKLAASALAALASRPIPMDTIYGFGCRRTGVQPTSPSMPIAQVSQSSPAPHFR